MDLWPAWLILTFLVGGSLAGVFILFVDATIDSFRRPRGRRWTPMG